METTLFLATKAFIIHQGKVLLLRESPKYEDGTNSGRLDVPGGRLKPGEHFKESLLREIKEETGLAVTIGEPFFVNEWRPKVKGEQWQVVGIFFECTADSDAVRLSRDHFEFQWISPADYKKVNLIPNLIPAFEAFLARTKRF